MGFLKKLFGREGAPGPGGNLREPANENKPAETEPVAAPDAEQTSSVPETKRPEDAG